MSRTAKCTRKCASESNAGWADAKIPAISGSDRQARRSKAVRLRIQVNALCPFRRLVGRICGSLEMRLPAVDYWNAVSENSGACANAAVPAASASFSMRPDADRQVLATWRL